jgi:hypothetical protein
MGSQVILATAGYDHTIKLWEATSGICYRTLQYADSQVTEYKQLLYVSYAEPDFCRQMSTKFVLCVKNEELVLQCLFCCLR